MHKLIYIICGLFIAEITMAACFIEDVIDLHDSGYSSSAIRKECKNRVIESDCSLSKLIAYAKDGRKLSSILRRCETKDNYSNRSYQRDQYQLPSTQPARICSTPYGTCPMAVAIPQGASCYCPSAYGPVWGIGR